MKRIFISSTCFFLIVALCIFEVKILENHINPLIELTSKASVASNNEDYAQSEKYMRESLELWEKSLTILGILLRHNEIDNVSYIFTRCYSYALIGDNESLQVELFELKYHLNHIINKEKLTLKNIF